MYNRGGFDPLIIFNEMKNIIKEIRDYIAIAEHNAEDWEIDFQDRLALVMQDVSVIKLFLKELENEIDRANKK